MHELRPGAKQVLNAGCIAGVDTEVYRVVYQGGHPLLVRDILQQPGNDLVSTVPRYGDQGISSDHRRRIGAGMKEDPYCLGVALSDGDV